MLHPRIFEKGFKTWFSLIPIPSSRRGEVGNIEGLTSTTHYIRPAPLLSAYCVIFARTYNKPGNHAKQVSLLFCFKFQPLPGIFTVLFSCDSLLTALNTSRHIR